MPFRKPKGYREADCCANCRFAFEEHDGELWCHADESERPSSYREATAVGREKSWPTPEWKAWATAERMAFALGICDSHERGEPEREC